VSSNQVVDGNSTTTSLVGVVGLDVIIVVLNDVLNKSKSNSEYCGVAYLIIKYYLSLDFVDNVVNNGQGERVRENFVSYNN
jgi:hypothetical protein